MQIAPLGAYDAIQNGGFLVFFTFLGLKLVFLDKIKSFTHNYSFKQLNMWNMT